MKNHVWVLEVYRGGKWRILLATYCRRLAREKRKLFFLRSRTRIVKYIPEAP